MTTHDEKTTSGKVENINVEAEKHIGEKDGKWILTGFDKAQGVDANQTFDSRQLAIDAATNFLRSRKQSAA